MDFSRAYGNGCPQCIRTSTILEALFSRIHILERQVAQQSADKDAANRALYRLLDVQSNFVNATRSSPSIATCVGVTSGCSEESSTSSSTQNVNRRFTKSDASSQKEELLIDLLTSSEYPAERPGHIVRSPEGTEFQSFDPNTSKDAQGSVQSVSVDKSRIYHDDAADSNAPYAHIRRFPKMMNDSTVAREPTTHMERSGLSPERLTLNGNHSCSFSEVLDNQENLVHSDYPSLNKSLSDHQETFTTQIDAIEEELLKVKCIAASPSATTKQASRKQRYGLKHSIWASGHELRAFPVFISPDERWAKYFENIDVRDTDSTSQKPMNQSSPNQFASTSPELDGEVANLNQCRLLDVCGLFFNPHDTIEQDSYRTVIISGLPIDCTMTQVLKEVRGGMILKATSLDTTAIIGSKSVMLTFVEGAAAKSLKTHVEFHGFSVSGQQVNVSLVQTPTTPMSEKVRDGIKISCHSRCLDVRNFPRSTITPQALRHDLRPMKGCSFDLIESMSINAEEVLELRFLSIDAAVNAFYQLTASVSNVKYSKCRVAYGKDPCSQPWAKEEAVTNDIGADELPVKSGGNEGIKTRCSSVADINMDDMVINEAEIEEHKRGQ